MRHLGSLRGKGRLLTEGKQPASVDYKIDVWQLQGARSGSGVLVGAFPELFEAFKAERSTLELQGGSSTIVVIEQINGEHADILTSGPVPGF